jgi:hypothetical protein
MNESRCDEILKPRFEQSTCLTCTGRAEDMTYEWESVRWDTKAQIWAIYMPHMHWDKMPHMHLLRHGFHVCVSWILLWLDRKTSPPPNRGSNSDTMALAALSHGLLSYHPSPTHGVCLL